MSHLVRWVAYHFNNGYVSHSKLFSCWYPRSRVTTPVAKHDPRWFPPLKPGHFPMTRPLSTIHHQLKMKGKRPWHPTVAPLTIISPMFEWPQIKGTTNPPVNVYRTMENHHAINGQIVYFYGHVQYQTVSLPEAKSPIFRPCHIAFFIWHG